MRFFRDQIGAEHFNHLTETINNFTNVNVNVTLVDRNLAHVWKPLLHEVAAGALDADLDGVDYRVQAARSGFRFQPGELINIDTKQRSIRLAAIRDGAGAKDLAVHADSWRKRRIRSFDGHCLF